MAKKKIEKFDGLGPDDKTKIRTALRRVWAWSYSRRLVVKRCSVGNDFSKCELCSAIVPKIFIDHINEAGEVDSGFIERLFVSSDKLQGLCKSCHSAKTKAYMKKKKQSA